MTESTLFAGCILVIVATVTLLARYRTALLGLNVLNLFTVASATLSTFFVGSIFDLIPESYSSEQLFVVSYSIAGLLAMVAGIYIGWSPLAEPGRTRQELRLYSAMPKHFSVQIGWLTFIVGTIFGFGYPFVYNIPTVSTAFNCLSALQRLGLFIILIQALGGGSWKGFMSAFAIFILVSIVGSLGSGFSFIRIGTLVPLFVIWYAFRGFTIRNALAGLLAIAVMTPLVTAWLDSRDMIRGGTLQGLSVLDKSDAFFQEYFRVLQFPNPNSIMRTITYRVDMTDILADQTDYQPRHEPYAYGETIFSSLYTLIPRFMWPDKPEVAGGSEFVARFTGRFRAADDDTSVGLPYPFELYANGGWILVILGLGAIGYIGARLELGLFGRPRNLGSFWAQGLVTIVFCEGGQRTDVVLPAIVASALAAYALGKLFQKYWLDEATNVDSYTRKVSPTDGLRWRIPPH